MKENRRADSMYSKSFIRLSEHDHRVMQETGRRLRISLGEVVRTAALPSMGLGTPRENALHALVCETAREVASEHQPAA